MKRRLLQFDIAKAICIILVAIGHYLPDGVPLWYKQIHDWIYMFHMPLFMFASGYIYNVFKKDETYGTFIWKKFRRLMVPYFFVSVLVITLKLLMQDGMSVEHPVGRTAYLRCFYLPEAGTFLWFVWSLFSIFCIIPFFKTPLSHVILFLLAALLQYWRSLTLPSIFSVDMTAKMLIWFMLGVVSFDMKGVVHGLIRGRMTGIIKAIICLSFVIGSGLFFCGLISRFNVVMPWLGIGTVMISSTWVSRYVKKGPLLLLGSACYVVYLLHTSFMGFAKSFVYKIPAMNEDGGLLFCLGVLVVVSVGIVIPVLLYKYVLVKTPLTKLLFGLR